MIFTPQERNIDKMHKKRHNNNRFSDCTNNGYLN